MQHTQAGCPMHLSIGFSHKQCESDWNISESGLLTLESESGLLALESKSGLLTLESEVKVTEPLESTIGWVARLIQETCQV